MALIRSFGKERPNLGRRVFVADTASVIGAVELADDCNVWYGAVLRGDVGRIRIGARSNVQDNACIHMTYQVSDAIVGSDVVIAHNAVIHGAIIGNRALIGMGAVVMDNARIGDGAWIAAGSVVPPNTEVPAGTLFRGSPAREARPVREQEAEWASEAILRYLELAAQHRIEQRATPFP